MTPSAPRPGIVVLIAVVNAEQAESVLIGEGPKSRSDHKLPTGGTR